MGDIAASLTAKVETGAAKSKIFRYVKSCIEKSCSRRIVDGDDWSWEDH